MKKQTAALCLALLCLLTACGGGEAPGTQPAPLEAVGLTPETVLLTVDGREVPAGIYCYWLSEACADIQAGQAAGGASWSWETPAEGGTLAELARSRALEGAALYATVENWAERYGCALTEEDRADLADAWAARSAEAGGEAAYLARLAARGLDRAGAERMAEDHYLYCRLSRLAGVPGSPLCPAEEELAAFSRENGYVTLDLLLVSKAGAGDQAALDQRRQKAEELFSQLNRSEDPEKAFSQLADAHSDAKAQYPCTIRLGESSLPAAFQDALRTLGEGQLSGIVEAEEGYGILLRLPTDLDALREPWFDQRLQTAAAEAQVEVTAAYGALSVADFQAASDRARRDAEGGL